MITQSDYSDETGPLAHTDIIVIDASGRDGAYKLRWSDQVRGEAERWEIVCDRVTKIDDEHFDVPMDIDAAWDRFMERRLGIGPCLQKRVWFHDYGTFWVVCGAVVACAIVLALMDPIPPSYE